MVLDAIDRIARGAMAGRQAFPERQTGYLYHHGRATALLALALAEQARVDVDRECLYAGGLFHDVGKGEEPHHEIGAATAARLLEGLFDADRLAAVCEIIRNHNRRRDPAACSPAARLVQDADVLDHLGAMQIWLKLWWSAVHDESVEQAVSYLRSEIRGYETGMRPLLNYAASREAFDRRMAIARSFADELDRSARGIP